ncbi:histidinol-phosphatase HisJ [Neobacillus sp. D3-1R]|uniref:histidinol-phosphatase HisJ n=1 Tax=Neobacillus sp. D3-1R TaxID=3445778 RepID=UPI003FA0FCCB
MKDGHIHTPFCPHGTKDEFGHYIEKAIELGYQEISFTEHAPLPANFIDTTPTVDSAMSFYQLDAYFHEIEKLKKQYRQKIKINAGLEVDFIEGFEEEIKHFLNEVGPRLDDSILSVHFLRNNSDYQCVDYSPDVFESMIQEYGSINNIYQKYFETLTLSIITDLGTFKPKRIGHITLIKKFHKKFPASERFENQIFSILHLIKEKGYELDYNGAGTAKPLCREPYPPDWIINEAKHLQIPLVYGSDAHQVKELHQGRQEMVDLS